MLETVKVDYSDLLQFTLQHWPLFQGAGPTSEELRAAAEGFLTNSRAVYHLRDYAHMQYVTSIVVEAVEKFYDGLSGQLAPLLENTDFGLDMTLRLSRYMHKDIVIHLEKPLPSREIRHGA